MNKATLLGNKSKTIPPRRFLIKNPKELNEFRIPLYFHKENRMYNLGREFESTININTNNYRKMMDTYFE